MKKDKNVLLHVCCGICAAHPISMLKEMGYNPIAYFYNPNIDSQLEYQKRLHAMKIVCKHSDCELLVEDYVPDLYNEIMVGFESFAEGSERCTRCFELRLLKTALKAQELNLKAFSTSIINSNHKDFNIIKGVGEHFSKYFNFDFLGINYKKNDGVLKSNKIAKELNLYRQNYCGCSNSKLCSIKVVNEEGVTNGM